MENERPLVGVDDLNPPKWTIVDQQVADAGIWRTLRELPAGVRTVARLAWRASARLTLLTAMLALASGAVTAFGLLATSDVFTQLLAGGAAPERVVAALPAMLLVMGSFSLRALLESAGNAAESVLKPRVEQAAQEEVHASVARVELIAFEDSDFADLLRQCLIYGVRSIETSISAIAGVGSSLINLSAAVITAGLLHPMLAPVVLLSVVPNVWASARAAKLRYRSYLRMVSRNRRLSIASELITDRDTAAEMRACTAGSALLTEYRRISRTITDEAGRVELAMARVRLLGRAVAGIGTGVAFFVLGLLLHSGSLALAMAGAAVIAMRLATSALTTTMMGVNTLYENTLYLELYNKLLQESKEWTRDAAPLVAPADPDRITTDNVSFNYPGATEPALSDVSLTIHKGQTIALVGENGSGKSTLAKVITGLYRPTSGHVRWDEVDLAEADEDSIYQNIAVVMQEPARWPMTARDNIRIGRLDRADPTGEIFAAAAAESGADSVLANLPNGADTVLSRHFSAGQDLSGGQWQRISVARGLYRDSSILVADEPTAAMDAHAEHAVFESFRGLSRAAGRQRTMILITHRLANIQHADQIVVLDRGRIVEHGTHAELLALEGTYASLYNTQAAGYHQVSTA